MEGELLFESEALGENMAQCHFFQYKPHVTFLG
jgi:hypothetical protein